MQKCPNCGQPTAKTKDWACPFCAYPLTSPSFKEMPQTYKELQEEKGLGQKLPIRDPSKLYFRVAAEPEPALEDEPEPEPEPVLEDEPEPEPEPALEDEPEPEPEPVLEDEPEPEPEPVLEDEPEPEPEPEPKYRYAPGIKPKRVRRTKFEPKPQPAPRVKREPKPQPEAAPEARIKPEPVLTPEPDVGSDEFELDVEQLYARLQAGGEKAEARYENQIIKVTGVVYRKVINDNLDVHYLVLTGAKKEGEWKISCTFDKKHEEQLTQLTLEKTVTVQGRYEGYKANVLMKDCAIVE
ncbi:hypothetical protein ACFLYE_00645 [Chloroflexota bacterium]